MAVKPPSNFSSRRWLIAACATLVFTCTSFSIRGTDAADGSAPPSASIAVQLGQPELDALVPGVKLFSDREYQLKEVPPALAGKSFVRGSIAGTSFVVTEPGLITLLIPVEGHPRTTFQGSRLERAGFARLAGPESFWLFGPDRDERVCIYQKQMQKGESLSLQKFGIVVGVKSATSYQPIPWNENRGEKLYNGIVLPEIWPPRHLDIASAEPMDVQYLQHPPRIIPIDRGRQLFVDDFLIEQSTLTRTYHRAQKYEGNPVFRPETSWELTASRHGRNDRAADCYLGHGGVFYDPVEQLFKLFYTAGWRGGLAMATSTDMVHWHRPDLNLAGDNLLLPPGLKWHDGPLTVAGSDNCLWLDLNAPASERIKYLTCWDHVRKEDRPAGFTHAVYTSDGRTWSAGRPTGHAADYCSFFYNPFRNVWVYSVKRDGPRGRCRFYAEHSNFMEGADWSDAVYWTNADRLDEAEPAGRYPGAGEPPQLYSLNAVAYESVLVGMHYILRGPNNAVCDKGNFPKLTDLEVGFSRDGFHWDRPDRRGFIVGAREAGTWDRAYLHSTAGVFVVLKDQLVFPYTGYSGISPSGERGMYTGGSVGIATLRRDGFASMDADGTPGVLQTRPVTFSGERLFVNINNPRGTLRVAILDEAGAEIPEFTSANCNPLSTDSTLVEVTWAGAASLASLKGKPVRFRFELTNGSLFAFWVSPDETGRSNGFVAAGGPGYPGVVDTVGKEALAP